MKNKVLKIGFGLVVTVLILFGLGYYLYLNRGVFLSLENVNFLFLIPSFILMLLTWYLGGLVMKFLVEPFDINLKEYFWVSISNGFINLITPFSGGVGVRAVYMKKKYNLRYVDFISTMFGNYILIFLSSSFIALFVFLYLFFVNGVLNILLFLCFLLIFVLTLFFVVSEFRFKSVNFLTKRINKVLDGWMIIVKHPDVLWKLVLVILLNFIVVAVLHYLLFWSLGVEIGFLGALYLSVMGVLAIFINITPGGLGISEFLYFVSAGILQVSAPVTVLVALIYRAIRMIILLLLGPVSNFVLYKAFKVDLKGDENVDV